MSLSLIFGFLLGVVAILAVEGVLVLLLIDKLSRKNQSLEDKVLLTSDKDGIGNDLDFSQSLDHILKKQGSIWILEPEKLAKITAVDKVAKEPKKKKEILEVSPVRKYAKIKDRVLTLSDDSCDSSVNIPLKGCTIDAVSATSLSSKKWAKRYPIKLESKTAILYKGSFTIYIYLDTCWEKESWCRALRVASCEDRERLKWFKLSREFQIYLTSLNAGYPSLLKPSTGSFAELVDKSNQLDDSSSKVKVFLKKLARKASRNNDSKISSGIPSYREDRKFGQRAQSFHESIPASSATKTTTTSKSPPNFSMEKMVQRSLSSNVHSGSQPHVSTHSDAEADEKISLDEGTLCWNLLLSRLFFDARRNTDLCTLIQARIQRTLSNMRTPSYIGEVSCTGVNPGDLPPYIVAMRALPTDLNEVCALEIDLMYSGGIVLDIATRLEVRELEDQKESNPVGELSSDLLEEYLGEQLNLSGDMADAVEERDSKSDGSKGSKSSNIPKWKSIINNVAKQVSQVPIALAIRITSLQGTLRLNIKPPPSDQLWFGFTSMPDIDFSLESSVGDHKITNSHVAVFLINRFKAAIRETLVLPNCESVCIPWMSAEKNDWVPRDIAPLIWLNQDANASSSSSLHDVCSSQSRELKVQDEMVKENMGKSEEPKVKDETVKEKMGKSEEPKVKDETVKEKMGKSEEDNIQVCSEDECAKQQTCETSDSTAPTVAHIFPKPPAGSYQSLSELKRPLLQKKDDSSSHSLIQHYMNETAEPAPSSSRSTVITEERNSPVDDDDYGKPKTRWGRKAKMLDLGKKMSEKLEEKRRTIEEKSRSIVEKMRAQGNSSSSSGGGM